VNVHIKQDIQTLRILHIGKFFYPYQGGIENFLRDLAGVSVDEGLSLSVLVHQDRPYRPTNKDFMHGIEIIRTLSLGQIVYTPIAPSFPILLLRAIRRFKPDLLHMHLPNPSAFWTLFVRQRPPFVIHWHSDVVYSEAESSLAFFYRFYQWFEKRLLQQAKAIIVTSENYLVASKPLQPFRNKCQVIPMGLDPRRLYAPNAQQVAHVKNAFGRQPIVLSVGRFTHYKGFQFLIEAAQQSPGAGIVIVGDGALREPMIQKVTRLGLENRVFLLGHLSEVELHTMMAACDVFCLPSVARSEAFGLVLLEAMAFGKPLITTEVEGSGLNWVNQNGKTGLIVPKADPVNLAKAIVALLMDPDLRLKLGSNGNRRMKKLFHIRVVAEEVFQLYSRLHEPPPHGM
jgi:glycosyltransferase involved in cell wall biosynthesis